MSKNTIQQILFPIICSAVVLFACIKVNQRDVRNIEGATDDQEWVISVYDNIFREVADQEGVDWRLLSAIAYHESKFRKDEVSGRGAIGIMQIMPHVARSYNVQEQELRDPHTNIHLSAKLINAIEAMMQLPSSIPAADRMSLVLACYNGGFGHISDARRLARAEGEDYSKWSVVAEYLELLSYPEYYELEVVKYGSFTGYGETMGFVKAVMSRYKKYCRQTERAERRRGFKAVASLHRISSAWQMTVEEA